MKSQVLSTDSTLMVMQRLLARRNLDALFVHVIKNVRYLTGFTGSTAFALVTKNKGLLCTDFRYLEQASREVSGWEIFREAGDRMKVVAGLARSLGVQRLGFESTLSYDCFERLSRTVRALVPQRGIVEDMRQVKSGKELVHIREAICRAERALTRIKGRIKPGIREREIANRLERALREEGCRSVPFEIIVASGRNASMPHARPTDKKIGDGEFVIIDWGGEAEGYFSDMTRTFVVGRTSPSNLAVYNAVNRARQQAIAAVKSGVAACDIDGAARKVVREAGYGGCFGHGTGHGVGLDVHEAPRISWTSRAKVREGMVFTVEPGIYIPGVGGVRIEDMVLVQEHGCEVLTTMDRDLVTIA